MNRPVVFIVEAVHHAFRRRHGCRRGVFRGGRNLCRGLGRNLRRGLGRFFRRFFPFLRLLRCLAAPGQPVAGRRFDQEGRVLRILAGGFDLDPDALDLNAAAGCHILLDLFLQAVHRQRDADPAGHFPADFDQQAVPLVFEADAFRLDLIVLVHAFADHGFQRVQGNGQVAAFQLLQDEFVLALPVPEQHQQAVQAEHQQDRRRRADDDLPRRRVDVQESGHFARDVHAEEHLRHQARAGRHQDHARNGHQNTVQNTNLHAHPSLL